MGEQVVRRGTVCVVDDFGNTIANPHVEGRHTCDKDARIKALETAAVTQSQTARADRRRDDVRIKVLEEDLAADVYVLLDSDEDDVEEFVAVFRSKEGAEAAKVKHAEHPSVFANLTIRRVPLRRALAGEEAEDQPKSLDCGLCAGAEHHPECPTQR